MIVVTKFLQVIVYPFMRHPGSTKEFDALITHYKLQGLDHYP